MTQIKVPELHPTKHEGFGRKLAAGLKAAPALLDREKGLGNEFNRITLHVKGAGINITEECA